MTAQVDVVIGVDCAREDSDSKPGYTVVILGKHTPDKWDRAARIANALGDRVGQDVGICYDRDVMNDAGEPIEKIDLVTSIDSALAAARPGGWPGFGLGPIGFPCPNCKAERGNPCNPRTLGAHPYHAARVRLLEDSCR